MKSLDRISRKTFLKAALASAGALPLKVSDARSSPLERALSAPSPIRIENSQWRLDLAAGNGLTAEVLHLTSGIALARGGYSYNFGPPSFSEASTNHEPASSTAALRGQAPGL